MIIEKEKVVEAKQKLGDRNAEIIAELLNLEKFDNRNFKSLCPFHKEDSPSFVYNTKKHYYKCFGCGATCDIIEAYMRTGCTYIEACKKLFEEAGIRHSFGEHKQKTQHQYRYPKEHPVNKKKMVYDYLGKRGISKEVIDYCDVREDEHGNCVFNYYDTNDTLTMCKYRPTHPIDKTKGELKNWCQKDSDTAPLLYNMNRVNPTMPLVINEGENDCHATIQAGYLNAVSVPFGANNYTWIEHNWDWLEQFDSIIMASDNDEAGEKMRKECIYRLGSWRVKMMDIPSEFIDEETGEVFKIKDVNEMLYLMGSDAIMDAIVNAKDTPVDSLIDFSDIKEVDLSEIDGIYTGIKTFDQEMMRLFYGTFNILTGINGCVDCDTEYFNGTEWKKISTYTDGERVLQYNHDRTASLVVPEKYHKYECDTFWKIASSYGVDQCVSDEHNIVYETSRGNIQKKNVLDMIKMHNMSAHGFQGKFITTFDYDGVGIELSDEDIRVMCAVICDGSFYRNVKNNNRCRVNIKKHRKQERLREILSAANIEYSEHSWNPKDKDYISFTFNAPIVTKEFDSYWYGCSKHQLSVIADEVLNWDGCVTEKRRSFSTCIKSSADFIQFVFTACGYRSVVSEYNRVGSLRGKYIRKSTEYHVSITKQTHPQIFNCKNKIDINSIKTGDGYKYCFTVDSGMLVLRRNGKINITGNSGKSSFLHQLIAQSLDQDKDVWLYSKELPNYMSKNWQDYIFAGGRNVREYVTEQGAKYYRVTEEAKQQMDEYYRGHLKIYKDSWENTIPTIQTSMTDSARKFGSKLFIIDNLTAINLECGDNEKWTKQVDFINWCIAFAQKFHVVIILVIHPKKIETMRRLTKLDVAGLGSIVDLAHRLLSLYRVSPKEKEGQRKQNGDGYVTEPIKYDVILDVLKDRMRGRENLSIGMYYDVPSRRFFTNEAEYSHQYLWDKKTYDSQLIYPIDLREEEVFGIKETK